VLGRDYLVPDDVQALVVPCLAHRMLPAGTPVAGSDAADACAAALEEIVASTTVPV
jgi:MoxR-like ATPase